MSRARPFSACTLALIIWLVGWASVHAQPLPASPEPHYVRDEVGWLSPSGFRALDERLEIFERESSSQIVVGIFPKLPENAELFDFSQRLYEHWKPGGPDQDNGALLLIFENDREMRIHTGYGLEGALPDARCKQILSDVIAPLLRQGNREAAVTAGVEAMIAAAKGEYKGTGKTRLDQGQDSAWPILIILMIVGVIVIGGVLTGRFTVADVIFTMVGASHGFGGGGGGGGGGFSGGGGSSGGGGASGSW